MRTRRKRPVCPKNNTRGSQPSGRPAAARRPAKGGVRGPPEEKGWASTDSSESRGSPPGPSWGVPRPRLPSFLHTPFSVSSSARPQSLPKFELSTSGACECERGSRRRSPPPRVGRRNRGDAEVVCFSWTSHPALVPTPGGENKRRETWGVIRRQAAARGRPGHGHRRTRGAIPEQGVPGPPLGGGR